MPHQPDNDDADQRRNDTGNAQPAIRHIERCGYGAFGAEWERSEKYPLDRKEQADCNEEIGHGTRNPPARPSAGNYFGPGAVDEIGACGLGRAEASGGILPEGSMKKRKKSESGLRTRRVSPRCMLFS